MNAPSTIRSARLVLRRPAATDLPAYTAYCTGVRAQFVGGPYSAVQAVDKFAAMIGHWTLRGIGRYIITKDDIPIGHVGPLLLDETTAPEMTWTLWDSAYEWQGIASEAARAVVDGIIGVPIYHIHVLPENLASIRVAEKIGAQREDTAPPAWMPKTLNFKLITRSPAELANEC